MTNRQVRVRLLIFQIIIFLVFVIFGAQLVWLQLFQGQTYQALADQNRFRSVEIDAPRGIMYDRNGQLLVRNRPTYDVVIIPAYLPDDATAQSQIFARLAELLKLPITNGGERDIASHNGYYRSFLHHEYTRLPDRQVRNSRSRLLSQTPQGIRDAVYNAPEYAPYQSVVVATDVDPEIVAVIEEERLNLPGVFIDANSERDYLTGPLTAQALGYVGPIPPARVDDYPPPVYNPNDMVGLTGIEAGYEDYLHGIKGEKIVEVDVTGQEIQVVGDTAAAVPGNNLNLTLDLDLQTYATEWLAEAIEESGGQSGALIALDPRDGAVLSMVSLPTYDNNLFAQGISAREYSLLSEDEATPLVNKAIGGQYPPGSTYKIAASSGSLQEEAVFPEQTFFCGGIMYLPNKFFPDDPELAQPFYCWLRDGHRDVNAWDALAYSCDIYYYQVGGGYQPAGYDGLGLEGMVTYAEMLGFGTVTGIDIPGEGEGLVPTERWKRLNYAEAWVTGDSYNMAIGQGYVLATPLQVVNAYAALGNGGTLYSPYLVDSVVSPQKELLYQAEPRELGRLALSPDTLNVVREGLEAVVSRGTAKDIIDVPGVQVAAKTGTAEYCDRYPQCLDRDGRVKTSHAWFTAYAPAVNPEIAVIAFVYGGGEGSLTAGPVVNNVLRYHFGIDEPTDEADIDDADEPTPRQRAFDGRLLGVDYYLDNLAVISGKILDDTGLPLAGQSVTVLLDGQAAGQFETDTAGQFDYVIEDLTAGAVWQVILLDANASPITLEGLEAGNRYLVEFKALAETPPTQ